MNAVKQSNINIWFNRFTYIVYTIIDEELLVKKNLAISASDVTFVMGNHIIDNELSIIKYDYVNIYLINYFKKSLLVFMYPI